MLVLWARDDSCRRQDAVTSVHVSSRPSIETPRARPTNSHSLPLRPANDWPKETSHRFQRHIVTRCSFRKEAPTSRRESAQSCTRWLVPHAWLFQLRTMPPRIRPRPRAFGGSLPEHPRTELPILPFRAAGGLERDREVSSLSTSPTNAR
ncbi:hypothetical protein P171DRAFT_242623 [Karstenula rhodostoma CBS 690.94]|uniref:Uncharacterized protein n=1 Tax=Karstenula rhodostoma CBS 690.94 TaxID=1392251 RepID=A0A9P4PMK9_9PLEO|nr:hypothetical protein P171DRAFT_242623 [Karstenula rhodostoma CBS 690.94]